LAALLCLAAVLYAALAPGAPGLLWAVLVPVWFFFAAMVAFAICREARSTDPRPSAVLSLVASRAPPVPQI
jgi:hypothetical protein